MGPVCIRRQGALGRKDSRVIPNLLDSDMATLLTADDRTSNLFLFLGSSSAESPDEHRMYHSILERLRTACHATLGALLVKDHEQKRYAFRAAYGLTCPESAVCNLAWSPARKLKTFDEVRPQSLFINLEDFGAQFDFSFEKMLGFRSLCFQPLVMGGQILGAALLGNRERNVNFSLSDRRRLAAAAQTAVYELERIKLYQEVKVVFINSVRAFVSAIDAKDPYTHGHSERVTDYALKIAETLSWNECVIDALRVSAILHDIGKIGVPEAILGKPGRLTEEEYALIKRHPEIGAKIIGAIPQLNHTLDGILYHHERYDGQGYPRRLAGQDIPAFGRLIAVADAYDAMTTDRPYRKGLQVKDALQELLKNLGTQFDPEMVAAFLKAYERGVIV